LISGHLSNQIVAASIITDFFISNCYGYQIKVDKIAHCPHHLATSSLRVKNLF